MIYIAHHGIKGQKWGVRRFQNENGQLTNAGKTRYQGMNYTTTETPTIHRVKVKGAGSKYGHYRNTHKNNQTTSAQAPSYSYGNNGVYNYSGESTGNYTADSLAAMLQAKERKEKEKENRKIRLISKGLVFIDNVVKSVKSAPSAAVSSVSSAVSNGASFVSSLFKH